MATKHNLLYKLGKEAKVGDTISCANCRKTMVKVQWANVFCCPACKDAYWNKKGDRHKDDEYYKKYNMKHPDRLLRIGIDITDNMDY